MEAMGMGECVTLSVRDGSNGNGRVCHTECARWKQWEWECVTLSVRDGSNGNGRVCHTECVR